MALTIFLADDHQIVRQGLKAILDSEADFRVIGEADSGLKTLRGVKRHNPDVLLLDLMMADLDGIEVARQVAERSPRTRIVVLSMHGDEAYARMAFNAGVDAYVLKEAGIQELILAIREVVAGRKYVSPALSQVISKAGERMPRVRLKILTTR